MLLGAARILKEMEDELPGTVKLMFQPGEEMGYGSRTMVEDGLLENRGWTLPWPSTWAPRWRWAS